MSQLCSAAGWFGRSLALASLCLHCALPLPPPLSAGAGGRRGLVLLVVWCWWCSVVLVCEASLSSDFLATRSACNLRGVLVAVAHVIYMSCAMCHVLQAPAVLQRCTRAVAACSRPGFESRGNYRSWMKRGLGPSMVDARAAC
jgi:hypothetical protein